MIDAVITLVGVGVGGIQGPRKVLVIVTTDIHDPNKTTIKAELKRAPDNLRKALHQCF
jgi:hypothetical protein